MKKIFSLYSGLLALSLLLSNSLLAQDETGLTPGSCQRIYENSMQYYKALGKFLPPNYKFRDQLPTHQFMKMEDDGCALMDTIDLYQRVVSLHSQKIAVMLPFSRWSQPMQKALMTQVKGYVASKGFDPEKTIVWLDTNGQIQKMQEHLANLVYTQHVSLIIGGLTIAEAPVLAKWGDRLRIPTIILNKKLEPPKSRYVFRLGPDHRQLARALLKHAEAQGYKKIAVMIPQTSRDGAFADAMMGNGKIEIVGPLIYNPGDYSSIDKVFKRLFHLNDDARKPELLDLVNELKDKSKEEGVAFDPKGLMLPPEIDVDAIVIIDHFKNVRHLAKSLHFYGVKRIPLLGIPKWRAPELVDQDEENLNGAVFVDYIGSYKRLPYGIKADIVNDENMVEGSEASLVDLELVVNHAVAAALQAFHGPRLPRYALYKRLEGISPEDKAFFGNVAFFNSDHEGNWPNFLFSVGGGKLQALNRSAITTKAPAKAVR
ncbi:MAG: ABC transporter substrate-binding protein [Oligoflexus sp.]|nr:ABC transporter substrate-binding protein [Oligoflexus sp.]